MNCGSRGHDPLDCTKCVAKNRSILHGDLNHAVHLVLEEGEKSLELVETIGLYLKTIRRLPQLRDP